MVSCSHGCKSCWLVLLHQQIELGKVHLESFLVAVSHGFPHLPAPLGDQWQVWVYSPQWDYDRWKKYWVHFSQATDPLNILTLKWYFSHRQITSLRLRNKLLQDHTNQIISLCWFWAQLDFSFFFFFWFVKGIFINAYSLGWSIIQIRMKNIQAQIHSHSQFHTVSTVWIVELCVQVYTDDLYNILRHLCYWASMGSVPEFRLCSFSVDWGCDTSI